MATTPQGDQIEIYDEVQATPAQPQSGFTYQKLVEMFPEEDRVRREIIDGDLYVTPPPTLPHQAVAMELSGRLWLYAKEHGGKVFAPGGVYYSEANYVEPDIVFVRADHLDKLEEAYVRSAPDVVVEISSPSSRKLEVVRKRELYETFEVPEYWYVDLQAERIELYRLVEGRYEAPKLFLRADILTSEQLQSFTVAVDDLVASAT